MLPVDKGGGMRRFDADITKPYFYKATLIDDDKPTRPY